MAVLVVVAVLFGAVACDSSVSGGIPPTTGILIRAEALTAGRGCGRGPTQLYKYAVLVYGYDGEGKDPALRTSYNLVQVSNVFDCYVDGAFLSLKASGTNQTYRLEVYAYNEAAYTKAAPFILGAGTVKTPYRSPEAPPTWTTECTATQSAEVETLAQCDPLSAGLGAFGVMSGNTPINVATQSFRLPDGRVAICVPGPSTDPDAGAIDAGTDAADLDAGAGAGPDASDAEAGVEGGAPDAAVVDSGPDAEAGAAPLGAVAFKTARIRTRIGNDITAEPIDVTCPSPYLTEVPPEPASYTIDVGLLDDKGGIVGQTACTATTGTGGDAGAPVFAVCP